MSEEEKKKALDKWKPILDSMGVTGSKADWMSRYVQNHSILDGNIQPGMTQSMSEMMSDSFPSLLPTAIKIAAKTISNDLVTVQPMSGPGGNTQEEMDKIKADIKAENRQGKIDSIIEDKEYEEKDITDHPDYKGPVGNLLYIDYQYGSTNPNPKRRKKGK